MIKEYVKALKEDNNNSMDNKGYQTYRSVSPQRNNLTLRTSSNYNYRLLQKIEEELSGIDPENLMLHVDPQLNCTKTIEQIQFYYYNIKKEMNKFYIQEQKKKMLHEKLENISKQIDIIVRPLKNNEIPKIEEIEQSQNNYVKPSGNEEKKKENKPVIDYRVKIRSLEKELEYTYQGYNSIKSKNNLLINQLDEMRKQNIFHMNKLNGLKKLLKEKDEKFQIDKAKVEDNLKRKDESQFLNKLIEKQNLLNKVNKEMTENIKETNIEITQKKAKKKFLDFEQKKLEKKTELIESKHKMKIEQFNNKIKSELDKIKEFNEESEILKCLDMEKMEKLENLLNDILEETKTENTTQLIEFLTKSCEENIKFKNSVIILQEEVNKLEKEVSELEYILSFCQDNLSVKKKAQLGEKELNEIEKINKAREIFVNLQYLVINDLYKNYTKKFFDLMKQCDEIPEKHLLKSDGINDIIGFLYKIQERLRKFAEKIKNNNDSKEAFDFNRWNNKWDKIIKVKDDVIKEYMKNFGEGMKFDTNNIKNLVDEYLVKEKNNKEKKFSICGTK